MDESQLIQALQNVSPRMLRAAEETVVREGGFVNHPNDPGGATNHGVSIRYARGRGTLFDLDGDGDVDVTDIRAVTPEMAAAVFLIDFYLEPGINNLPAILQPSVFDMAVNAGSSRAIMIAQRMFNGLRLNDFERLSEDGVLGPKSIDALRAAGIRFGGQLVQKYADERIAFYRNLARQNPSMAVFLRGWESRARDAAKE